MASVVMLVVGVSVAVDASSVLARTTQSVTTDCTDGPRDSGIGTVNPPNVVCASTDVPKNTGVGTVTSTLVVPHDRKIQDLNVVDISLSLSQADDINVGLTSPSGTFVFLWEGVCGTDVWDQSNTGFDLDDVAGSGLGSVCPPGSAAYFANEPLSMFNGQSAMGTWTLTINDATPQPTQGTLHGWGLQITFPWLAVNSTDDSPDANTSDGVCDDGTSMCTLRAAIQQANADSGPPDTVIFSRDMTISPGSPLPTIADAVTIFGRPFFGNEAPRVVLDGSGAGAAADGLVITASDTLIEFLGIGSFGGDGVEVSGRSNIIYSNVISGNSGNGVKISGSTATNNRLEGNQIVPNNGGDGVLIDNAPSNAVTGGTIAENRGSGIHILGSGATGNKVSGLNSERNDGSGVFIDEAPENEIATARLRDHSFGAGVRISGGSAYLNVVRGSEMTTNRNGVHIENSAQSNTVGGYDPADRNLISSNSANGVLISGKETAGNQIAGNYIGTDLNGTSLDGNAADGVLIDGAPNNTVGGGISGRNVISGNEGHGVHIKGLSATGNQVAGNYIGLDASGQSFLGNNVDGVHIEGAPSNVIGGDQPGFRNVISGNGRGSGLADGVEIEGTDATGNKVQGNYIGTDSLGAVPRPNTVAGVVIRSSSNIVGGSSVGERNVISGNVQGVSLDVGATGNQVIGNYIGTDAAGAYAIGNNYGVSVSGASNVIGGSSTGEGNLVSGNVFDGVSIVGQTATSNNVKGNLIGTNPSGTADLGNGRFGVSIEGSSDNDIGGPGSGEGNLIAGNDGDGVRISGGGFNRVAGNRIGTNSSGQAPLPNTGDGVFVFKSTGNAIGGTPAGLGNTIAYNSGDGILVDGVTATGSYNEIRGNAIFDNTELGIDLAGDGVTPNDPGDGDTGPNDYQNFPVLTSVSSDGTSTTFEGTLDSSPENSFELDFFFADACDPSGHGEGAAFLGWGVTTTDAAGHASFSVTLPGSVPSGDPVTATAMAASGATSEFSACQTVREAQADLSLIKTDPPGRAPTGRNLKYTLTITNSGPDAASGVSVVDQLPTSVTFVSAVSSQGTCGHSAGTVTCNLGTISGAGTATVEIVVKPTVPGTISNTASVSSTTRDPNASNNSDSESTTVCRITSRTSSIPCP